MKITCPSCATSYALPDGKIGANGRSVRCKRCGTVWLARPDSEFIAEAVTPPPLRGTIESTPARTETAPAAPPRQPNPAPPAIEAEDEADDFAKAAHAAFQDDPQETQANAETVIDGTPSAFTRRAARGTGAKGKPKGKGKRKGLNIGGRAGRIYEDTRPMLGGMSLVAALVMLVTLVIQRNDIVAAIPDLAGLYRMAGLEVNLRGLEFADITTHRETENGQPVLVVEGAIRNVAGRQRPVPAVRLALKGENAGEIYAWSVEPRARDLPANETIKFRTRLASPPAASDIEVRFIDRRTKQAATP
jgi:predicted Zn finger-like uncharacterized protein